MQFGNKSKNDPFCKGGTYSLKHSYINAKTINNTKLYLGIYLIPLNPMSPYNDF